MLDGETDWQGDTSGIAFRNQGLSRRPRFLPDGVSQRHFIEFAEVVIDPLLIEPQQRNHVRFTGDVRGVRRWTVCSRDFTRFSIWILLAFFYFESTRARLPPAGRTTNFFVSFVCLV